MPTDEKFAKTADLLSKWALPVGEEKTIKIEIGGDELYFKIRILSAKEMAEIRAAGLKPDGSVDMLKLEEANNEFIRKAVVEPEVNPEKLHPVLRDLLLAELLKAHGYSEDILSALEKKLKRRGSGSI
jgi:hypothetical protein